MQDLKIQPHNLRYRLEVWQTPDGQWQYGELPATLHGGHFGPGLRAYVPAADYLRYQAAESDR